MSEPENPFANLGSHLRTVREQLKRSLAEVSGAVEIEQHELELIEAGQRRPEEDVMLLLISYFNVQDQEALHLWELAQYDSDLSEHLQLEQSETGAEAAGPASFVNKPMVMVLAMDVRTMYSDGLDVTTNRAGITLQFTQSVAHQTQPVPIARVGMSQQQAELVIQTLQTALLHAKYNGNTKFLPPPKPQA
jgi:transcriptional regulator with XRE-family HTH domain